MSERTIAEILRNNFRSVKKADSITIQSYIDKILLADTPLGKTIEKLRQIRYMEVIQIDITNQCDGPSCSNCTRNLCHHSLSYNMSFDVFCKAVDSLQNYHGIVGVFGGNPILHQEFEKFSLYLEKSRPFNLRGIWTNNYGQLESFCRKIYGVHIYNDHAKKIYHQPSLVAIKDIIDDEDLRWKLIANCPVNHKWSACITPTITGNGGVYFCEVMSGLDYVYNENNSLPIEKNWWRQPNIYFRKQIERFCENCGMSLPLPARQDMEQTDDVSESNLRYCNKNRNLCILNKNEYNLEENLKGWLPLDYAFVDIPIRQRNIKK